MKKTIVNKSVSLLLAVVMLFGVAPTAFAKDFTVGTDTTVTVEEPNSVTVTGSTTTTDYVYVLTSTLTNREEYLIVNSNSASDNTRYALRNNSGSVGATGVTVKNGTLSYPNGTSGTATYIELDDAEDELWTAGSGWTFQNDGYYLRRSSSNLRISNTSASNRTWSYSNSNNQLSNGSYYLRYSNGWSLSTSRNNVYFYKRTEVISSTTVRGTYSIVGNPDEVSAVVEGPGTATLGSTLTFAPESGSAAVTDTSTTATYTKVDGGDPNGVISGISGNVVSLTGNVGTALVKVSYTGTAVNGESYTVFNYITVTVSKPHYTVDITHDEDKDSATADTSVTETIVIKGVVENDKYDLNAVVNKVGADGSSVVENPALTWQITPESDKVASIDPNTGTVTFDGTDGTIQVAVYYKVDEHTNVSDIVTISVMQSQYVVPEDGTNDFPEYPNEGSVRIDKTATAVGNFNETGMAMVEISMSGVPYTTGSEVDVVMMMDMTGSMSSSAIAAAKAAALVFAETIVKNEDGSYNKNRVAVLQFNTNGATTLWNLSAITEDTWDSFESAVNNTTQASGGTPYNEGLSACNDVLTAARTDGTGNDRMQFCVFMSDGGPTSYEYITNYDAVKAGTASAYSKSTASASGGANLNDNNYATIATYTHEYYSTLMKDDGVTVYSVGTGFTKENYPNCATILTNIATDENKAYFVASSSDTTSLKSVFSNIASEIKLAATDIEVEDVISDDYTMTFTNPTGVTSSQTGMDNYFVQVVEYELDPTTKERTGTYTVLEVFERSATGKWTHTVRGTSASDAVTCDNGSANHCSHIALNDDGTVSSITGTHFNTTLNYSTENGQVLNWNTQELHNSELALQYFVHLEGSVSGDIDPGTYPTNKYATVSYTNYKDNECQLVYPEPQLTYNGAQVSYVFYLVNENGEPVNRAGRVVPFAEAVYVTEVKTFATVWEDTDGSGGDHGKLEAPYLAYDVVPEVYELYDQNAYYEVNVYADEGKADYFIISGSADLVSTTTTKVFNTKAGERFDSYGAYSKTAGTYTAKKGPSAGVSYEVSVLDTNKVAGFDLANTTVAFAVTWKPELVPDEVVLDFGIPVVIDAGVNDALNGSIVGVRMDKPDAEINKGQIRAKGQTSVELTDSGGNVVGTVQVVSLTSVQFTPTTVLTVPATFYYEYTATYYVEEDGQNVLTTATMYSSVTIVPASNVLYEEGFMQAENTGEYGSWTDSSNKGTGTQSPVNSPCYGFDTAYSLSTGLGGRGSFSAAMPAVGAMTELLTTSFYGIGFDLIGTCADNTGYVYLVIKGESTGKIVVVNTRFQNAGDITVSGTLYQVPLAHVMLDDTNAAYTVSVYGYCHEAERPNVEIDGFRVYRETNDEAVAKEYYAGAEKGVSYVNVMEAVTALDNTIAYIDALDKAFDVTTYESMGGPENEIYIKPQQTIVLKTDGTWLQASLRSVTGGAVSAVFNEGETGEKAYTVNHATELYYGIDESTGILTITNNSAVGSGLLLAVCNVKLKGADSSPSPAALIEVTDEDVNQAVYRLTRASAASETPEEPDEVFTGTSSMYDENFWPGVFDISVEKIKVGRERRVRLTITTSTDVAQLNVNGQLLLPDNYGEVVWGLAEHYEYVTTIPVGEDDSAKCTVIAYNEDGIPSWTRTIIA